MNRSRLLILFSSLLFTLFVGHANAGMITINLTGSVTDWDGNLGAQFSVGDELNMSYSYDSDTPDLIASDAQGQYEFTDYSGFLGSYEFTFISGYYSIHPNTSTFGDQIFAYGTALEGADVGGSTLAGGAAFSRDFDAEFLSDDSLLLQAPDLSLMEQYQFGLLFDDANGNRIIVRASIDSATVSETAIPAPATLLLFGLGLVVLGLRRKTI